ncbi:hypothetical protein E0K89_015340 [Aquicoccus sp. SCR17]|nr:hypothetical protein [Carideicomes alvinocaridis]
MQSLLEPPPEVLAFLVLKKFVYLEALVVLALVRSVAAHGAARLAAIAALLIAAVGVAAQLGPSVLGLYQGPVYRSSLALGNAGAGLALPLLASLPLWLSAVLPGRRWPLIDGLHAVLFAALLLLWWLGG